MLTPADGPPPGYKQQRGRKIITRESIAEIREGIRNGDLIPSSFTLSTLRAANSPPGKTLTVADLMGDAAAFWEAVGEAFPSLPCWERER